MIDSCTIETLNQYASPKKLRLYQKYIVEKHKFSIQFNETELLFVGAVCKQGKNILFFKQGNSYFSVNSFGISKGYELENIILVEPEAIPLFDEGTVVVRTGHENFAHFIWNQLPALLHISNTEDILFYQECNSIIDIKELGFAKVDRDKLNSKFVNIYVGSSRVNQQCIDILLHKFQSVNYKIQGLLEKSFKIYIGVRGPDKRELINEVEFYSQLINSINEKYDSKVEFIIDGFSFQNNNINDAGTVRRCEQINKAIGEIQKKVAYKVTSINGLLLSEFIGVIENIDFYITHEGTMQHKIGWFYPHIPGVILTGSQYPKSVVQWHCNQVEHDPSKVFMRSLTKGLIRQNNTNERVRNNKFQIIDIEKAIEELLNMIKTKGLQ